MAEDQFILVAKNHKVRINAFGWVIIAKSRPKVMSNQMPIYWTKKEALKYAKHFGGTVKKVYLSY